MSIVVVFVGTLLLSQQVLSQTDACQRVTDEDLGSTTAFSGEGVLADAINPSSEGGSEPGTFRVMNDSLHIVCEAQHQIQNRYKFTSVLVSYACQSTDPRLTAMCDGTTVQTVQLTLGCNNNAWSATRANNANFVLTMNPTATTSTERASNCRLCVNPDHPIVTTLSLTVAQDTHCVGKSHTVSQCILQLSLFFTACGGACDSGASLGRCYGNLGPNGEMCCNFFDNNVCVENCSTGLFPSSEFECIGKLN